MQIKKEYCAKKIVGEIPQVCVAKPWSVGSVVK